MPKRTIINMKVDNIKPNVVKMRAYNKSMTIAKTALPHFKPFHKSLKRFASPFRKMLFKIRMTERAPSPTLDQKKIKPDPGEENVPSPKSTAMMATKIEIANQNKPLMTVFSIHHPAYSFNGETVHLRFQLDQRALPLKVRSHSCLPSKEPSRGHRKRFSPRGLILMTRDIETVLSRVFEPGPDIQSITRVVWRPP